MRRPRRPPAAAVVRLRSAGRVGAAPESILSGVRRKRRRGAWLYSRSARPEVNEEAGAGGAGLAEGGAWGFWRPRWTVEEIFAGGEDFDLRAKEAFAERAPREVVRGVGVEAEVAVEEIGVGVVVELAAAEAAFEAEGSEARAGMRGD